LGEHAATIVRSVQATPTETHFTLQMADGQPMEYEPGQIVELSLFGYGEIPIGVSSSRWMARLSGRAPYTGS
jgi:NAD(P)H-flavin reductase